MKTFLRVVGGIVALLVLLIAGLLGELSRKYAGGSEIPLEAVTSGYLWLYELAPRS